MARRNQEDSALKKKPEFTVAEFARIRAGPDPNSGEFGYTGGFFAVATSQISRMRAPPGLAIWASRPREGN
jgi:hypothetical protein